MSTVGLLTIQSIVDTMGMLKDKHPLVWLVELSQSQVEEDIDTSLFQFLFNHLKRFKVSRTTKGFSTGFAHYRRMWWRKG